jgi:endonuclease III
MPPDRELVKTLLDRHGRTYADEAGIRLADNAGPLYQLLVLVTLLSTHIRAEMGVAAARELFTAGYRTPRDMARASWQDRVNALGRAHYRRYDERTATMLGDGAQLCQERWQGDLRRLHAAAAGELPKLRAMLIDFSGIGPTGADIFLREVQGVWRDLWPYVDRKVIAGAQLLGLPASPDALAGLVPNANFPRLASALVRVSLRKQSADELLATSGRR